MCCGNSRTHGKTIPPTSPSDHRICSIFCRTVGPRSIRSPCAATASRSEKWSSMQSDGGVPRSEFRPTPPRQLLRDSPSPLRSLAPPSAPPVIVGRHPRHMPNSVAYKTPKDPFSDPGAGECLPQGGKHRSGLTVDMRSEQRIHATPRIPGPLIIDRKQPSTSEFHRWPFG